MSHLEERTSKTKLARVSLCRRRSFSLTTGATNTWTSYQYVLLKKPVEVPRRKEHVVFLIRQKCDYTGSSKFVFFRFTRLQHGFDNMG